MIRRVCRSTLSPDAHASVTAVDAALWFQVLLTAISTRHFDYKRLTPPTEFPPVNPFRAPPSDSDVRNEDAMGQIHASSASTHSANRLMPDTHCSFNAT